MSEDKMLIKKEKIGIFQRISNYIRKIFFNTKKHETVIDFVEKNTDNNLIKELEEKRKIIELQNKYESNIIREEELSEEEKERLTELYKEQIKTLENNILNYQQSLRIYRNKIIEMKNNIQN